MRLAAWGIAAAGLFCVTAIATPAGAAVLGPQPYLCFDNAAIAGCGAADSPFAGGSYSYFHLETAEDGLVNTPGVQVTGVNPLGPSFLTDSVDADDGTVDGSGTAGWSLFGPNATFIFSAAVLGALPTDVGVAWTDGSSSYTFSFFDGGGALLGSTTAPLGSNSSPSLTGMIGLSAGRARSASAPCRLAVILWSLTTCNTAWPRPVAPSPNPRPGLC